MTRDASSDPPPAGSTLLQETADIALEINFDLIERRRSVRPIPCPEAVERDDEESWSTWNELMAQPVARPARQPSRQPAKQPADQSASAAMATLRHLLRRKQ